MAKEEKKFMGNEAMTAGAIVAGARFSQAILFLPVQKLPKAHWELLATAVFISRWKMNWSSMAYFFGCFPWLGRSLHRYQRPWLLP